MLDAGFRNYELYETATADELQSQFYQLTTATLKTEEVFQESVGEAINLLYAQLIEILREEGFGSYCTFSEAVRILRNNEDLLEAYITHLEVTEADDLDDSAVAGTRLFKYWIIALAEFYEIQAKVFSDEITYFALKAKTPRWNPRIYEVFDSR